MPRSLIVLLVPLFIMGCSREAPPQEVDKAAQQFFERLSEANYDKIYDDSAKPFQEQNARLTVLDNLKQITALGRIQGWQRLRMTFENEGKWRLALPVYSVRFEQVRAEITLKLADDGGEWKLMGFAVRPFGATRQ